MVTNLIENKSHIKESSEPNGFRTMKFSPTSVRMPVLSISAPSVPIKNSARTGCPMCSRRYSCEKLGLFFVIRSGVAAGTIGTNMESDGIMLSPVISSIGGTE